MVLRLNAVRKIDSNSIATPTGAAAPTYNLNIAQPFEAFKQIIDEELARVAK